MNQIFKRVLVYKSYNFNLSALAFEYKNILYNKQILTDRSRVACK